RLKAIARQFRQQPELMRQEMAGGQEKISKLLTQIEQPAQPLVPQQARQLAAELEELLTLKPPLLAQLQRAPDQPVEKLQLLLSSSLNEDVQSSPALLGHVKDFVDKLVLATVDQENWSPELRQIVEQILGTMRPLAAQPQVLTQVGQLGVLSQLFGLNLEAELLRGRERDVLNSLKLALLGKRGKLGSKGEEAVHRIELFQICRVKLAEQNVVFVPLPLPFLEEGFLLVDRDGESEQGQRQENEEVRMTLHLKLSVLGNLRIDMLTDSTGILLRVTCEDKQRADFLQGMSTQLREHLQTLPLRGVSFTSGVESPARELLKKILPLSQHMLDARV
ncbi:MAG: hypothetical protein L3J63_12120, partial [Geopsychrobacter sp.]|nr:hypothetical protein [Geopsychrobacter sp.]